jgi:phospholipase/carboxylesterase
VPTAIDTDLRKFHDRIFRFRPATTLPARLLVLLHGWTGDENSMWVFARKLPAQVAVMAPRGLFAAPEGGYTWREIRPGSQGLPTMDELHQSADTVIDLVDEWSIEAGVSANSIDLIGFSQGAALSYVLALLHPDRIRALAALSGFIPIGAEDLLARGILAGKPVFVAHGRQDDMIPVELGRRSVALLEASGAQVTYCESDGGHKVGTDCFTGLVEMFGQ